MVVELVELQNGDVTPSYLQEVLALLRSSQHQQRTQGYTKLLHLQMQSDGGGDGTAAEMLQQHLAALLAVLRPDILSTATYICVYAMKCAAFFLHHPVFANHASGKPPPPPLLSRPSIRPTPAGVFLSRVSPRSSPISLPSCRRVPPVARHGVVAA
ncbi:unnamed protein product [Closterium sp. NIES-53]